MGFGKQNTYLEHLNESNAKIQIGLIATDKTCTVKNTDRYDGPEVDSTSHLHGFPTIEERRRPCQDLGHDS